MRRPSGFFLAAALVVLPLFSQQAFARAAAPDQEQQPAPQAAPAQEQQPAQAAQPATPPPLHFDGDVVLWAFTVPPDKTADYEQVIAKLKAALQKIERPEAKQQLAGWKIMKNGTPQGDGTILYIHVIEPVVKGADYSITNLVYEAFTDPTEQRAFYELYRGAIKQALFTIQGPVVTDFSQP
jgi:hypothetical protein